MKFIVSSSLLYKELQNLGGVINSSNTIPILDNFLFQVNNNKLQITSSDLESSEELLAQESIRPKANAKIVGKKKYFSFVIEPQYAQGK